MRIQAATDSLQPFFEDEHAAIPADRVLVNLYNATRRWSSSFVSSTFDDVVSTGNLRLIRDPKLRSQLADLYGQMRLYTIDWYGPEYRVAARKAIPIAFQFRVRAECGAIAGDNWRGCQVSGDKQWEESVVQQIRKDNELRGAYRLQAHEIAIFYRDLLAVRTAIQGALNSLEK
jgi:hypothetical protein